MPLFKSWRSYSKFEWSTKHGNRYIYDSDVIEFLSAVLETSTKRQSLISKDTIFWRAQLGNALRPIIDEGEEVADEPCPLPPELMKPLSNMAYEGRTNPKGIPHLYLATSKETAMSEVRPWIGSYISVGQFKTVYDLKLIDCSVHHNKKGFMLCLEEPEPEKREEAVWIDIDRAFSKPVTTNDNFADYVPTQILSELFKKNGFDGIIYKSTLGEGFNVVLFKLDAAELINRFLYKAKQVSFIFTEAF